MRIEVFKRRIVGNTELIADGGKGRLVNLVDLNIAAGSSGAAFFNSLESFGFQRNVDKVVIADRNLTGVFDYGAAGFDRFGRLAVFGDNITGFQNIDIILTDVFNNRNAALFLADRLAVLQHGDGFQLIGILALETGRAGGQAVYSGQLRLNIFRTDTL